MDIPEDHLFSEAQLERLAAAFERVDEFVRIENDRASVDATANDVDMSEELFAFVTDRIEATNRQREIEKNVGHTGYRDAAQAQTNSHDPPA
ncbi:MAG: hypothetical protein LBV38_03975 [Alistipes sp.]|nr:hypothetical protein [Alistipes sp.]